MWNKLFFLGRNKRSPQTALEGAPPPSAPQPNRCTATNKNGVRKYCIFPFRYRDRDFYECTKFDSTDAGGKAWCSTEVSSSDGITALSGSYLDCDPGCSGGKFVLLL